MTIPNLNMARVYLRVANSRHKTSTQLIGAKSKIAPLKTTRSKSLPLYELCGTVLAIQLA
jgi:hypothetical protein